MKQITVKKQRHVIIYLVFSVVFFYLFHWLQKLYAASPEVDVMEDFFELSRFAWMQANWMKKPWLDTQFTDDSMFMGMLGMLLPILVYLRPQVTGTFRYGEEHGSAKFATKKDLMTLRDQDEDKNMIFTQNAQMGLYNKRLAFDKQINKNVLVIGGTGDWKTRSFVKPNALQRSSSYVFTDTKGLLVHEMGQSFERDNYQVKVFDVITFLNSNRFNVFRYMKDEMDIDRVAEALVTATKRSDHTGEDFWIQAEMLLQRALIGYLFFDSQLSGYTANLPQITDLIRHLKRTDPDVESPVEVMFEELEKSIPGNYAYKQWRLFNDNFNGETRNSVFAIIASRYSVFDHDVVRALLEEDNMEMETWNTKKTAVFVSMPEVNPAYQFITALFFSTFFDVTFKTADDILLGKRTDIAYPLHLQIEADEFAQVGKIPNLPPIISVIRSREISIKIMIQSLSQVEELYGKNNLKTILNNCGTILYLGTNDPDTLQWLSKRSGASTINDRNTSENRGRNGSNSVQNSKLQRMLLTEHEIATIAPDEALVFINKHNVFYDKKYRLEKHKRYNELAERSEDSTWYRYKRYMSDIEEYQDHVLPSRIIEITEEEVANVRF
ncbi:VirD4-like conjugal transfer protein, CD1115 family [Streptococcus cameli]